MGIIIESILILIFSILLHELGHQLYFRYWLKRSIEIRFSINPKIKLIAGHDYDYENLTRYQNFGVNLSGIIIGFIPIFAYAMYESASIFFLLPLYIVGCQKDMRNIWVLK